MSVPSEWQSMTGEWSGDNRLWLSPEEPVRESATTARLALTARGRFLSLRYTWAEGGKEQEGELLIGLDPKTAQIYFQSKRQAVKDLSWKLGRKVNFTTMQAIYGFGGSITRARRSMSGS